MTKTTKKTGVAKTTSTRKASASKKPAIDPKLREAFVKGAGVGTSTPVRKVDVMEGVTVQKDCDPDSLVATSNFRRLLADMDKAQVEMLLALRELEKQRVHILLPDHRESSEALEISRQALVKVEHAVNSALLSIKLGAGGD